MSPNNTFIYSPACPRCIRLAVWLKGRSDGLLSILPYTDPGAMALHPNLNYTRATRAPQLILNNGRLCEGAEAVAEAIALRPGWAWVSAAYAFPLFTPLGHLLYWLLRAKETHCAEC